MKKIFLKTIWLLPLILGLALGIFGITKVVQANNIYVPEMGEEGWFDAKSDKSGKMGAGIACIVIGFVAGGAITFGLYNAGKHMSMTPEELAEQEAKNHEKEKLFKEKYKELTGEDFDPEYDDDTDEDDDWDDDTDDWNEEIEDRDTEEEVPSKTKKTTKTTAKANKYCDFCGSANPATATKCSSCGAGFSKN